ncbi:MAG: hypothetical protein FJ100_08400 [Deltaproteobacteria bacterium]|nr:hypothetical protein [Deltaproteobacteria bacterium]
MAHAATGTTCDDGNPCTAGDACTAGKCLPGTNICTCSNDAECAKWHDGDFCKGTLYCNKSGATPTCVLNPATAKSCSSVDDTACAKNTCAPATGQCLFKPVTNGLPCEDGAPCTFGDYCQDGKCASGASACQCQKNSDCEGNDDGNLCNGTWFCDKSDPKAAKCAFNPASLVYCSKKDDTACLTNTCDPKSGVCGLTPTATGTPCDDGSLCTASEACSGGTCVGAKVNCDDSNVCTADACAAAIGCVHSAANCSDGNACTADVCDPKTGQCAFDSKPLEGKACNGDDNGCTAGDTCKAGQCAVGAPVICKLALGPCEAAKCASTGPAAFQCVAEAVADGTPCAGSDGCLLGAACGGGNCLPGKAEKLFVATHDASGAGLRLRAAAAANDGGWLAVGRREVGPPSAPTQTQWWMERAAAGGATQWATSPVTGAADPETAATAAKAEDDGTFSVVGTWRPLANEGLQARLVRLAADGKVLTLQQDYGKPGKVDDAVSALAAHPSGGWVGAGWRSNPGGARDGWLVRVADSGKQLWEWEAATADADELAAVVAAPAGTVVAVGWRDGANGTRKAWAARVGSQGALQWQSTFGTAPWQQWSAAVASGGGVLAAGTSQAAGTPELWLAYLDGGGQLVWQRSVSGWRAVGGTVALANDAFGVVGSAGQDAASAVPWLLGLAGDGHPVWDVQLDKVPGGLAGAAATADGGILAVGAAVGGGGGRLGLAVRGDAWGRTSCASAGKCATIAAATCADTKPCTDDWCEPKVGCLAVANTEPCSDGDACTVGDACKLGACGPGKVQECGDGNPCTADACDPLVGCQYAAISGNCDDGKVCTDGDACAGTVCGGKAKGCSDGNPCTADTCSEPKGCASAVDPKQCDDGNVCTTDSCDKVKGCSYIHNSAACDDGISCYAGDTCANGSCVAGSLQRLYVNSNLSVGTTYLRGLAALPEADGGALVAMYTAAQKPTQAWLVKLDPGGQIQWSKVVDAGAKDAASYGILGVPDGALVIGYTSNLGAGGSDGLLHRVDKAGQPLWSYAYGGAKDEDLIGAAPLGTGYVAVGRTSSQGAGGFDGWLLRVTADGVQISSKPMGGSADDAFTAIRSTADGGSVVAGYTSSAGGGGQDGWLVRLDAKGNVLWQHTYGMANDQSITDVAVLDDGSLAAVGLNGTSYPWTAWLFHADANGLLKFAETTPDTPYLRAVAAVPGGYVTGSISGTVVRRDLTDRVQWSSTAANVCTDVIGLSAMGKDGVLAVGGPATGNACAVRFDNWGNTSCALAGKCPDLTPQQCDDGAPCTRPGCDPKAGCTAVPESAPCTSTAACTTLDACANGACVPGKPKLWDVAKGSAEQEYFISATPSRAGGFLAVGHRYYESGYAHYMVRSDDAGNAAWEKVLKLAPDGNLSYAAAELPDGRWAVAGAKAWKASLRVIDAAGNHLHDSQVTPAASTNSAGNRVSVLDDDQIAMCGDANNAAGFVARFTDRAEQVWATTVPGAANLHSVNALPGGHIEAWGAGLVLGKPKNAVRAVLSGDGKVLDVKIVLAAADYTYSVREAAAPGGDHYLAITEAPLAYTAGQLPARTHVARVTANGDVVWRRQLPALHRVAYQIAVTSAGLVVAGWDETPGPLNHQGWLAGVSSGGQLAWERLLGSTGVDELYGVVPYQGGLVLSGYIESKGAGKADGWLVRLDAWGQGLCSVAGGCAKLAPGNCDDGDACTVDLCSPIDGCGSAAGSCDDGNPCTVDSCSAKVGCTAVDAADGTSCGGGKVCKGGACGP